MDSNENNFKNILRVKVNSELPHHQECKKELNWGSIDDVYDKMGLSHMNTNNYRTINDSDKKTNNWKLRKRHMIFMFEDMHKEMKHDWQPFGFLQKSTCKSFVKSIASTLKIKKIQNVTTTTSSSYENEKEKELD